jgi:PAS domain S-box-containing protein
MADVPNPTSQQDQAPLLSATPAEAQSSEAVLDALRKTIDTIPALAWSARPDGSADFFNQHYLDFVGLSAEQVQDWGWTVAVHPDDLNGLAGSWRSIMASGKAGEREARLRRFDGEYRWFLFRTNPLRNESGDIVKWFGINTDIEDRKRAEEKLRRSERYLAEAQRSTHIGCWAQNMVTGQTVYLSQENYRIFGFDPDLGIPSPEEYFQRIHPEDRDRIRGVVLEKMAEGSHFDLAYRILLPDRTVKHLHSVGRPVFNELGDLVEFVGTTMDISERKQAEEALRRSEHHLLEAQRISRTGSWKLDVLSGTVTGSPEMIRMYGVKADEDPSTFELWFGRTHIEDRKRMLEIFERSKIEKTDYDADYRIALPDGNVKHIHTIGHPVLNETGDLVEFVGTNMDITERKQAEEALRRSEGYLAEAQRLVHIGGWVWNVAASHRVYWSQELYRIFGFDPERGLPSDEALRQRIHPEDRDRVHREAFPERVAKGSDFDVEYRIVLPDGAIKHLYSVGHPVLNESGDLVEFVGTTMDITERKQAEEKIREQEVELRQILDVAPQFLFVLGSDGSRLYANQSVLEFRGLTIEEWQKLDFRERFHPDDVERIAREREQALSSGFPLETEARMLRHDGKYRWFLLRYKPLRDQSGRITRWVVPAIDIDDHKRSEERLQYENVALREEIDKASMFEEIVGTSPALQTVLSRVSKVAATDSTVLITGETGTGKELVARAIHRRSPRSSYAFVSVNSAAIPRDLIASELFGHEKGSFTGATQRRLGRFELADRGTIFLDEVGELPAETQIALLRVLQEHEFERVGGAAPIRTDVRVIAATNRDLEAAIAEGKFRSDLFFRLNVFPIDMPPLRERPEDIPLLVEYFIDRYARKAGKSFQWVNKKSLDLFQSYPWPGNIRELQNVIERSVIVCETENFSVDESWLSRQPPAIRPDRRSDLFKPLPSQEKAIIEAALSETGGRVYGPSGAAAKLGIPRSTLESKIRSLKVDKNRFKIADPPKIA